MRRAIPPGDHPAPFRIQQRCPQHIQPFLGSFAQTPPHCFVHDQQAELVIGSSILASCGVHWKRHWFKQPPRSSAPTISLFQTLVLCSNPLGWYEEFMLRGFAGGGGDGFVHPGSKTFLHSRPSPCP